MQEEILKNDELRLARAIARAEEATDRLNKICDLLEIRVQNNDVEMAGEQGEEMTCERMACAEDAILELAETIGEIMA